MDRFLHGYNNRFVPIEVPVEGTNQKYYMKYKGRYKSLSNPDEQSLLVNRRLTWCDVFFIATVEATRDKQLLISRFPINFSSNLYYFNSSYTNNRLDLMVTLGYKTS